MGLQFKKTFQHNNKILLTILLLGIVLIVFSPTKPAQALVQDGVELPDDAVARIRAETNPTLKWAQVQHLVNAIGVENYQAVLVASEFVRIAALVWRDDLGIEITTVPNFFDANGTPTTQWDARVEIPGPTPETTTTQDSSIGTHSSLDDVGQCSLFLPSNVGACIYEAIAWIVNILIELFGKVLAFCAWVFRIAIKLSIIDFKDIVDNDGTRAAWQALRDISNMFFIFILLYAAIGTILQIHKIDAKKIVINVVVIAILINFSFLICTLIIDAGNQLALFFYDRITTNANGEKESIDVIMVSALKLSETTNLTGKTLKNDVTANEKLEFLAQKPKSSTIKEVIVKGIGAIIIILMTAFLLAAAAYMFLARAVILALLTVVSPLAFLLMAFPPVGAAAGVGGKFWNKLINQTLFAPAYLTLIYAVLVIIKGGGADSDHGGVIGTALYFFIVAYMLYWCFSIAISFGAEGASAAQSMFNKGKGFVTGTVAGAAVGAGAMAYAGAKGAGAGAIRGTAGRGLNYLANNESVRGILAKVPVSIGGAGMKLLDKGAKGYKETKEKAVKEKIDLATRLATNEKGEVNPDMLQTYSDKLGAKKSITMFGPGGIPGTIGIPMSPSSKEAAEKLEKAATAEKLKQGYRYIDDPNNSGKFILESTETFNAEAKKRKDEAKEKNIAKITKAEEDIKRIENEIEKKKVVTGKKQIDTGVLDLRTGRNTMREEDETRDLSADEIIGKEAQIDKLKERIRKAQIQLGREEDVAKVKTVT